MQYTILKNDPASTQAATAIRAMLIEGEIKDGERINEVRLAEKLEISRTPVREGLGQLVAEQFVEIIPRRGFFATALTEDDFSQLYDLRPLLDPHALLISSPPSETDIAEIDAANQAFIKASDSFKAVRADNDFHTRLLARCPNKVLLQLIANITARTLRYELALFKDTPRLPVAGEEHAQIIQALRDSHMARAADALRRNLSSGKEPILAWLSKRTPQ